MRSGQATAGPDSGADAGTSVPPGGKQERLYRIGAVASRTGVSERTLRYYEELGLLRPAAHRPGGSRLYDETGVQRMEHIRELQGLMGFNLEEIRGILAAEDRVVALRGEYRSADDPARQREVLEEGTQVLENLRAQVQAKQAHLQEYLARLDAKIDRLKRHRDRRPAP